MTDQTGEHTISLRITDTRIGQTAPDGYRRVTLATTRGDVECRHYPGASSAALIWLGDSGGGWVSPANDLYSEMAREFVAGGVSSLHVRYRFPGVLAECALDAIAGIAFLADCGDDAVGIVGHGFGAPVAIQAAASIELVKLVVGLGSDPHGADPVAELGPRCAVSLIHGTGDRIFPPEASRAMHAVAAEPKGLWLYEYADHDLGLPAREIRNVIREMVERHLAPAAVFPPILSSAGGRIH